MSVDIHIYDFDHQGDTERLAKFKIRIEDPPRRKDMVRPLSTSFKSILVVITFFFISPPSPYFFYHCDHRQVFIGGAVLADVMKDKEEFWITKVFIIMMQIINLFSNGNAGSNLENNPCQAEYEEKGLACLDKLGPSKD